MPETTTQPAQDAPTCPLPIVTLSESKTPTESNNFACKAVRLSGDREILVGHAENGERFIRIRKPEPDGGTCQTQFGLNEDAAYVLGSLLAQSFVCLPRKEENSEAIHPQ